jgi:RNA polymerase sigma factor (sigma-70 family)
VIEAATLASNPGTSGVAAQRIPLRRFQQDERLIALIRQGHDRAFDLLFNRYRVPLLAYCRSMVGSTQDAEDLLQDVFAAAHAAILADDRPIQPRPWLYRIARNRCINHLRKPSAHGMDSMDVLPHQHGASTLEQVEEREELRAIVASVRKLPKTQRTALILREIDDLSYPDIAQTMGKSLPSVKSLLVRARMSLAESSSARPALVPLGLVALLRKLIPTKLGGSSGAGATAGSVGSAGGTAGTGSAGVGGALSAKAAVGLATAALITAGAVSVHEVNRDDNHGTARAGANGISATAGPADRTGSPAANRPAGQKVPGNAAGAMASKPGASARGGAGSEGGRASTAGQRPAEPALPGAPAAPPAPSEGPPVAGHVAQATAQATAAVRELIPARVGSTINEVVERVGSLRPTRALPPVGLDPNP